MSQAQGIILNKDYIEWCEMQDDAAPHDSWKPLLRNINNMTERIKEETFACLAVQICLVGWPMFAMFRLVFDLDKSSVEDAMDKFADYLVASVPKYTESSNCIKRLRDGSWFDYRRERYNKINKKKKKIFNHLSQQNNFGNYQINSSSSANNNNNSNNNTSNHNDGNNNGGNHNYNNTNDNDINDNKCDDTMTKNKPWYYDWTVYDVICFLNDLISVGAEISNILIENEVTGKSLEYMDHDALKSIGFKRIDQRFTILRKLAELKQNTIEQKMDIGESSNVLNNSLNKLNNKLDTLHTSANISNKSSNTLNKSSNTLNKSSFKMCANSSSNVSSNSSSKSPNKKNDNCKYKSVVFTPKADKWWEKNELYLNENGNKQTRKAFRLEWSKELAKAPAVPFGLVIVSILGTATQEEIAAFAKAHFNGCKTAKNIGLLIPAKTDHVTKSEIDKAGSKYSFDMTSEKGKYAKKAFDEIVNNNKYLKHLKEKQTVTEKAADNASENSNQKQKVVHNNEVNPNKNSNDNDNNYNDSENILNIDNQNDALDILNNKLKKSSSGVKRRHSICTALTYLAVQPPSKKQRHK